MGYFWHLSQGQMKLLGKRISLEEALEDHDLTPEVKKKLRLLSEIKDFAREHFGDIDEDIYTSYVQLDQPYVSWILRVSLADQLEAYEWDFPVIGRASYKGFFEKDLALEEEKTFSTDQYDTYVGGVRAYSTLGWFSDPVLSSMMGYEESDFTALIFHELAHTVLFFEDHIDFNERFAEFLGRKSALLFYLKKEGQNSPTVQKMKTQWEDQKVFSFFMSQEYEQLEKWYEENTAEDIAIGKTKRLRQIQDRFVNHIQGKLKTSRYDYFPTIQLNNAKLLPYRTYTYNMDEFETLFNSSQVRQNLQLFIDYCSQFEDSEDPEKDLKLSIL